MLRVQQEDSENERIAELQMQLEEARRSHSELETENRYHTTAVIHPSRAISGIVGCVGVPILPNYN